MVDRRDFLMALAAPVGGVAIAGNASVHSFGDCKDEDLGPLPAGEAIPRPFRLRYAVNIDTHFTQHPVLDRLALVADAGFTAVEFNSLPSLERAQGTTEPNYDAIARYGEALKRHPLSQGVWVTNGCAGKCNGSLVDPAHRATFLRLVEQSARIAPLVEGTVSTVTSGIKVPGISDEEMTANVIEALKRAADIVEKAGGPTLVLEPLNVLVDHPGYHVVTSDHAAKIIDAVGSDRVKILYDIYHQQISEGNLSGNIRKHYDRIAYFQFGDHPGRHEPFTGEIHYPYVFQLIHTLGYTGMVGGEYSPAGGRSDEATLASLAAVKRADRG